MSVRPLLASLTSAVILMAPGFIALFPEPNFESSSANDSWQRGVVLLPLFFAATTLACLAAGRALMAKGYQSIQSFTSRASIAAGGVALALSAPSSIIGCMVGLFSVQAAVVGAVVFVTLLASIAIPAAAAWWFVAGVNTVQANEEAA